jgi:membrane protein required for colicin V production
MHWLDLVIIGVIAWITFSAFRRGLIRELVTLVAMLAGAVLAGAFYDDLSNNLEFLTDDEKIRNLASFAALLIGALIIGQLVAGTLRKTAHLLMLGPFDHIGGAAFGFVKGVVLVEIALIAVAVFPASTTVAEAVDDSTLAPLFLERAPIAEFTLPEEFENALDTLHEWQQTLPASVSGLIADGD